MRRMDCKWSLHWNGVDRSEWLKAMRAVKPDDREWLDELCAGLGDPLDEHDIDTINASLDVADLADLQTLLAAGGYIRTHWGIALHCRASDEIVSVNSSLTKKGCSDRFAPTSCSLSSQVKPDQGRSAILASLRNAETMIEKAVRDIEAEASTR